MGGTGAGTATPSDESAAQRPVSMKRKIRKCSLGNRQSPEGRQQRQATDWFKVDWSLRNRDIARLTGATAAAVSEARKRVGAPEAAAWYRPRGRRVLAKWAAVDWSEQDVVIAEMMRLTRERVRQVRQQVGAPKSKYAYRRRQRLHPWQTMDFHLPSATLERIWKLPNGQAGAYRLRKALPKPKWDLRRGVETLTDRQYMAAVRAEEHKAKERHATRSTFSGQTGT